MWQRVVEARHGRVSLFTNLKGKSEGDLTTSDVGSAQPSQEVVLHAQQAMLRCC